MSKKIFLCFIIIMLMHISKPNVSNLDFNKVIIWGHKLHSHTHSYIHEAFYNAFKHLGYETYWFDNNDNTKNFNFDKSLFLTEGQVDKNIPINESSFYLLHNCSLSKYKNLFEKNHVILFQVYTTRVKKQHDDIKKIDNCIYKSKSSKIIYMPWGTDLLPFEIDKIKNKITKKPNLKKDNVIYWTGTIGDGKFGNINEIDPFKKACAKKDILFKHITRVSSKECQNLIFKSFLAPAIVGKWQQEEGYIPCRIFKNISYGQFGITNSEEVYNLFDKKIVYNLDTYQLFFDALKKIKENDTQYLLDLMEIVKNKHTYLNRIQVLLDFLLEINNEKK